jgi:uncharacterized membrane protein
MKMWKILIQILIDTLVMIGLVCLMAHLITVWELNIVASSLFGILTGVVIVTTGYVIYIMFNER